MSEPIRLGESRFFDELHRTFKRKGKGMNVDDMYPSKWLKASDLKGRQVKVRIERIDIENLGDEDKPVLYFAGKEKAMVLNRTNAGTIALLHGDETDGWIGKEITLFATRVPFGGRLVPAIRISVPQHTAPAPGSAAEDDIPF